MPRHERRLIEPECPLFGNEIVHNYRLLRGWTQAVAAQHHGVSERTWRRYESPTAVPPAYLRDQIVRWVRRACPENIHYVS
jgi:hypothetical protein